MKTQLSDVGFAGKQDICKAYAQKPRKQTAKESRKGSRGKDGNFLPPNAEDEESEAEEEDPPEENAESSQEKEI